MVMSESGTGEDGDSGLGDVDDESVGTENETGGRDSDETRRGEGESGGSESGNGREASVLTNPGVKLEDCRDAYVGNQPCGRGGETASGRGYNAELLAGALLDEEVMFVRIPTKAWYDTFTTNADTYRVEVKSCIERYPSGGYGRFRIWRTNHEQFVTEAAEWKLEGAEFLYLFVVYTVEEEHEREVGKLVATAEQVDAVLDDAEWSWRDHDSMGTQEARDISWMVLLDRLGVSPERFRRADAIDLTIREDG